MQWYIATYRGFEHVGGELIGRKKVGIIIGDAKRFNFHATIFENSTYALSAIDSSWRLVILLCDHRLLSLSISEYESNPNWKLSMPNSLVYFYASAIDQSEIWLAGIIVEFHLNGIQFGNKVLRSRLN